MAHHCVYIALEYLLVLVVLAYGLIEIHEGIKCKKGASDIRIVGVSYNTCIKECRVREWCTGVSYHANAHVCIAHDSTAVFLPDPETECRGFVYSESLTWKQKTILCEDTSCDRTRADCTSPTEGEICRYKDCPVPVLNGTLTMEGTSRTPGSRIIFKCKRNEKINGVARDLVVRCLETGDWDEPIPTCFRPN